MSVPAKPTPEQCNENAVVQRTGEVVDVACWYPQMGGYGGRCVVRLHTSTEDGGCFEAWIWHDGEFPFGDDREPAHLHHCDPEQFIRFGELVRELQGRPFQGACPDCGAPSGSPCTRERSPGRTGCGIKTGS